MNIKNHIITIFLVALVLTLSGCGASSEPPEKAIKEGIASALGLTGRLERIEFKKYEITNKYTKDIYNELAHFCEFSVDCTVQVVSIPDGKPTGKTVEYDDRQGTVILMKRGDKWYYYSEFYKKWVGTNTK